MTGEAPEQHFVGDPDRGAQTDHRSGREPQERPRRQTAVLGHDTNDQDAQAEQECDINNDVAYEPGRSRGFVGPDLLEYFRGQLDCGGEAIGQARQDRIGVEPDGAGEGANVRPGVNAGGKSTKPSTVER